MPRWAIVAALLAALGYIAVSSSKKTKEKFNPKDSFNKGQSDGKAAAIKDKSDSKPSRVLRTPEDVLKAIQDPESWMHDESKSYQLGFDSGYLNEYIEKSSNILTSKKEDLKEKDKKEKQEEIISDKIPDEKPENWPNSCKWPPSSLDEMDAILEKLHEWESSSEGTMGTVKRKPSWLPEEYWPPICPPDTWPSDQKWPPANKAIFDSWKSGTLPSAKSSIKIINRDLSTSTTRAIENLQFGKCEGALGSLGDYKIKYISDIPTFAYNVIVSNQVRSMLKGSYPASSFDLWAELLDKEAFSAMLNGDKESSINLSRVIRCLKRERVKLYGEVDPADKLPEDQKYPGIRSLPIDKFKSLAVKVIYPFSYANIFENYRGPDGLPIPVIGPNMNGELGDFATSDELRYFAGVCRDSYSNEDAASEFETVANTIDSLGRGKNGGGSGISLTDIASAIGSVFKAASGSEPDSTSVPESTSFDVSAKAEGGFSATLGTRMSPEWANKVPYWYSHPSFSNMNKG